MSAELGFGIMRMPLREIAGAKQELDWNKCEKLIDEYMKGAFCYFDVHPAYMNGLSETLIKKLVVERYPREKYMVADKIPYYVKGREEYESTFTNSLNNLGVEYIDYYMLHAVSKKVYDMHEEWGGFAFLSELKERGLVKHIGFSYHDDALMLDKILSEHPEVEFVQLQINFLDWRNPTIQSRECYEVARKHKKQIMVMEPIKGGSLANEISIGEKLITSSELARMSLEFVNNLDGIKVILSGMSEVEHVTENRKTIADKLTVQSEMYEILKKQISERNAIPCTACKYCVRECPMGIDIPGIFSIINNYSNIGKYDRTALGRYSIFYNGYIKEGCGAGSCIKCGKCEARCPQKIEIRKKLKTAVRLFEKDNKMNFYTVEKNAQILIYLMKQHGVKKVIISPGTTNICFAYSVQQDGDFEIYSAADERSAAYMACGLAAESGEPVALSCTGATASRNYIPGLTEAYYRKLPILAVTASQPQNRAGNLFPQFVDRSEIQKDIARLSIHVPLINSDEEYSNAITGINRALLELKRDGGGPVHINMETGYNKDFSVRVLPKVRTIKRVKLNDKYPDIPTGKIGIFVGNHKKWSDELTKAVDSFCYRNNALVITDQTGNYKGKYAFMAPLLLSQDKPIDDSPVFDLIIHIGQVSGAYMNLRPQSVWRVAEDGEVCDTFKKMTYIFEMDEKSFFEKYASMGREKSDAAANEYKNMYMKLYSRIIEDKLPFSNIWAAYVATSKIPPHSALHLGILNSLRSWNFFEIDKTITAYSNTGGFGIDGGMSELVGASLNDKNKLHFGIIGDLAFFYDMNSLGNRHMGANVRLMLISNGCGTEFKNYNHFASQFGNDANDYTAAMGHYGNCSRSLVKDYAESLGMEYLCASNKEEFKKVIEIFMDSSARTKSILFEVFTTPKDESDALKMIRELNGEKENVPVNTKTVKKSKRYEGASFNYIIWGTGGFFNKYYGEVAERYEIKVACDNNPGKWGKIVKDNLKCVSPQELTLFDNPFVIIMIENPEVQMQIANQLLDMGISSFDSVKNIMMYEEN